MTGNRYQGAELASLLGVHVQTAVNWASRTRREVDETAEVAWVPVEETPAMIARGEILGAITIIAVQHVLLRRAAARVPPP